MELIFTLIILILVYTEYKLYRRFFTPFSIISIVYTILILLNNFIAIEMGFFKVSIESIFFTLYFLFLIFIISMCFYFFMKRKLDTQGNNVDTYINNVVYRNEKVIVVLFLIGLIGAYISLFQCIALYGLSNIKGKAFGIFAHIGNIGEVLIPYIMILYLRNKKKIQYLVFIILMFLNLFLFAGKYGIIIAFTHLTILYAMIKKVSVLKTVKLGIVSAFFGIVMFVIVYAIRPLIIQGDFNKSMFVNSLYFALRHFMLYLVGPLVTTNFYYNNSGRLAEGVKILFTVPINIGNALFQTGEYVNPINSNFIPVSAIYSANVGGLFAESVYCSGFFIASVYIGLFFCVVYYYYIKSRYRGEMLSLTSLLLAIVMMMFFSNFLTVSGIVLPTIYLWMIELFLKKKIIFKRRKNLFKD